MFFKKFLNQPNVIGSVLIALMICSGFVYTFAFNGFNVETATGGEVDVWLAAAGGGSSGGSGGGGTDDTPPESPTPEDPEDEEGEGEEGEDGEGGTEDTSPEESLPEDDEDDEDEDDEDEDEDEDEDDGFDWDSIDWKDTSTWPTPPTGGTYGVTGDFTVDLASKDKYGERKGEKSLYDKNGGEWRPAKLDRHHDVPHWDYKPYEWNDNQNRNIGGWKNIDLSGEDMDAD